MPNYNTAQLRAMASAAASKYGVDPKVFLAQINQESGFNPNAKSGSGAEGIAQFMPGTAASYHIDPMNPAQALDAAARYDSTELKAHGGDYREALAAYNAGGGNADKWNDPSFAGGQTYRYVQSILGAAGKPGAFKGGSKGAQVSAGPPGTSGTSGMSSVDALRQALLSNLMSANRAFVSGGEADTVNPSSVLQQMALLRQMAGTSQQAGTQAEPAVSGTGTQPAPHAAPFKCSLPITGDTSGEQGRFLSALQAAVKAAGGDAIKMTSGFRTPDHNAAVGGVKGSLHTQGLAMDGYAHIGGQWVPLGVALKAIASKYGLRSGDQPGFFNGGTDPVHVDFGYGR